MNTSTPSAQADFYTAQMNRAIARHDDTLTRELVELADRELTHRPTPRDRSRPRAWRLLHRVDAWTLWALNASVDRKE